MTQMQELAKPFPREFVHTNPSGGGSYVKHHVVEQRLIQVLGRPPMFEKVEVIFGDVAGIAPNPNGKSQRAKEGREPLRNVIVGVIARMTAVIDGETVVVEEAGDCEEPHNWSSDGQRLKDAMSDAYKRCAMRLGLGLHLWSQNEYFLYDVLTRDSAGSATSPRETAEPKASEVQPSPSGGPNQPAASPPSVSAPNSWAEEETGGSPAPASAGPPSSSPEVIASSWDELVQMFGRQQVWETAKRVAKELRDGLVPIKDTMLEQCSPRVYAATAEILAKDGSRQPVGNKA